MIRHGEQYVGEYFDYLCELINLDESVYSMLISELYSIPFEWVLDLDSDRNYDGFVLQGTYYGNVDNPDIVGDRHCSVLEILIVLAQKMDYILDDDDRGDRTRIWFWELIDNLGYMKFTNSYLEEPYGRDFDKLNEIRYIAKRWLNREFEYNGEGSPFPINVPHEDQRTVDLIRQLNAYILDKYLYNDELL